MNERVARQLTQLHQSLDRVLANGVATESLAHAEQVAQVAGVLDSAFAAAGMRSTLVGGSAIEVHAPGVYKSDDIDLVVEGPVHDIRMQVGQVLAALGFTPAGRHWSRGDLFVEVPSHVLEDPRETVRVGSAVFEIVTKEAVLAYRIVGFKQWRYAAYGQQAIDMLAAFSDGLDLAWLESRLRREDSWDAYISLRELADGTAPITWRSLQEVLDRLRAGNT